MKATRPRMRPIKNGLWLRDFGPTKFGECFYCKKPLTFNDATVDHVVPFCITRRTKKDLDNLVIACEPCNRKKGSAHQHKGSKP